MANHIKTTKSNFMKKLITIILLLFSFILGAADFEIIAKPGYILSKNEIIYLKCIDTVYEDCFFEVALKDGLYLYISSDLKDSVTLFVDSNQLHVLGLQSQKTIRVLQ